MPTADVEHVLVVPTQLFHDIGYIQGFTHDVEKYLDRLLDAKNTSYRPRPDMEEDPSFKQLIPYVIFRHTDDDGTENPSLRSGQWWRREQIAREAVNWHRGTYFVHRRRYFNCTSVPVGHAA